MSIPSWFKKINSGGVFITLLMFLVGILGFGLGRLSKIEEKRIPVRIEVESDKNLLPVGERMPESAVQKSGVVASKKGTKYHLPWCSGAQSIKEENKIWFDSPEAARSAGYTPASNCQGIE